MKKKFMAVLLTGAMAVSMVSGITVKADEKESYTIGFSPYTLTNEYFTAVLDGVQKACDETGNELIYFDPQNDPTQQASQIDDMIASGIDALIYIPYDSAGAQTVLQTCKDAGVKVINIDNVITEDDYELVDGIIASDNTQLGYLSGQWVAENHPDGANVLVVHLQTAESCIINVDGFWKGIKDNTENAEAFKEVQVVEGEGSTGGHDQTCAALGSGLISSENGEIGMGTCEFMFTMLPEIKMTPYMIQNNFTCIPYVLNNTYLSSIEVTTCGILKNWARDTIFQGISMECQKQGKDFWGEMEDKAKNIHTDILLLPQFGSAGNPDLSMDAKGTITGLTIHTKPEEIYRAILEGMAFQMYLAYERMNVIGTKMKKIAATGGGSVSDLTLQIRADVFGMEVYSLESEEAGTLGCMLMSAVATGAYKSLKAGIKKTVRIKKCFKPDSEMHRYYNEKFKKYKELYELMHRFR